MAAFTKTIPTLCSLSPKRTTVVTPEVTTTEAPPSTANVVTVTPNARTVGDLKGDLSIGKITLALEHWQGQFSTSTLKEHATNS